ncbi:MAG: hypothetical protein IPI58_08985 [Alphaproteobacteria bacterium]|nr:MAG: hypothetical protein IPI58_08985 [Alphaproteobacteria bacterium]
MSGVFASLLIKLLPLYGLVALGWLGGRFLKTDRVALADVMIYLIAPVFVFGAVARLKFQMEYLALPLILAGVSMLMAFVTLRLARVMNFTPRIRGLVSFAGGTGNTGYFGVPVVLAVLGGEWLGVYLILNLGMMLYEASLGYYLLARGAFSVRESLRRVRRLPVLYAMAAGMAYSISGLALPDSFVEVWQNFRGAYVVLGMMMVGISFAYVRTRDWDMPLLALLMTSKFILWPLLMGGLVLLDAHVLHLFGGPIHVLLMISALVPVAANSAVYAAQVNIHPERMALAVLLSTLLALAIIPAFFSMAGLGY